MLIAHIIFRFDYGGLENGVVNIINGTSSDSMRHVVIALTVSTDFSNRLCDGVDVHCINKKPGKDFGAYLRLYRLLRVLRPDIVHTRNLGTMECAFVAFMARVPTRIHGEHGWDIFDPSGVNKKYRVMRRVLHHFTHRVVTVSLDLKNWLVDSVGVPASKIQHICNGVDTIKFQEAGSTRSELGDDIVVGSVTRFSKIKDPLNLVNAFIKLHTDYDLGSSAPRLLMIGDGELRQEAMNRLRSSDLAQFASLPGSHDCIPEKLVSMDLFVLGSLKEGISNTILEAMACGLPVIASDAGGNPELIVNGETGVLVKPGDSDALAEAIAEYVNDRTRRLRHGTAARDRVVSRFSIAKMVEDYEILYENAESRWRN